MCLMKLVLQKQNKLQKHGFKQKSNIITYQRDVYAMLTLGSEELQEDSTPTAAVSNLSKLFCAEAHSF